MTDEELIKKLRDKNCCESPNCNCDISADRIEVLTLERDVAKEIIALMEEIQAHDKRSIEALTAERDRLEDHVHDLLVGQECGCGYDTPTDVCLGHWPLHQKTVARAEAAEAKVARLVEALEWYAEQTRLCQLAHSSGDAGRNALHADGGKRARAALTEIKGDDHE